MFGSFISTPFLEMNSFCSPFNPCTIPTQSAPDLEPEGKAINVWTPMSGVHEMPNNGWQSVKVTQTLINAGLQWANKPECLYRDRVH